MLSQVREKAPADCTGHPRQQAPDLLQELQDLLHGQYRQWPVLHQPVPDLSKRRLIGRGLFYAMSNPRYANGALRRKYRERFRAMAAPCGICGGRLGPIRYDLPSSPRYPLSFVIDEIRPISRWREFGYDSPEAAARDWGNLQAAHYCCNAAKNNRTSRDGGRPALVSILNGDW